MMINGKRAYPIIFSTDMIKLWLAGKKSQTRRIIKPQPDEHGLFRKNTDTFITLHGEKVKHRWHKGTYLYVRETCAKINGAAGGGYIYKADLSEDVKGIKWTPSIHCPSSASRIILRVSHVKVQRIQCISEKDCVREGMSGDNPRKKFSDLWISLYGDDSWEKNLWVWAVDLQIYHIRK